MPQTVISKVMKSAWDTQILLFKMRTSIYVVAKTEFSTLWNSVRTKQEYRTVLDRVYQRDYTQFYFHWNESGKITPDLIAVGVLRGAG